MKGDRNMSKHGFDFVTDSNASRMPSDINVNVFESQIREARAALEFLRIHSNALEGTTETIDA